MYETLSATLKVYVIEENHVTANTDNTYYIFAEKANGDKIFFVTCDDLSWIGIGKPYNPIVNHPEDLILIGKLFREERKHIKELIDQSKSNPDIRRI